MLPVTDLTPASQNEGATVGKDDDTLSYCVFMCTANCRRPWALQVIFLWSLDQNATESRQRRAVCILAHNSVIMTLSSQNFDVCPPPTLSR